MVDNKHMGELVYYNAKVAGSKQAISYRNMKTGVWESETWQEMADRVTLLAAAYVAAGIGVQDRVAIFSQNMREIVEADFALQSIRAVSVPMYATSSADQIEYIINDAEISTIFVGEQYQFDQAEKVVKGGNAFLKRVVAIDPDINTKGLSQAVTFADFIKSAEHNEAAIAEAKKRHDELTFDDLAVLIYTSGTTGEPKGVMLHHWNLQQAMHIHEIHMTNLNDQLTSMSFLPFSHVFERGWFYLCMYKRVMVYVNQNPKQILQSLQETRPNMMCAVPRFWEKVYDGVYEKLDSFPAPLRKLAFHAIEIGKQYNIGCRSVGKEPSAWLKFRYNIYKKTLFHALTKAVGIENGCFFPCAGSQTSEKVNIFMHSVGINLIVGYGLTETTATVCCYNPFNQLYNLKSVGDVMPEVDVKISEEGEILVKGKTVTSGYYKRPKQNAESFTADGYFRTGDKGDLVEGPNGVKQVIMIERIKELFKTSNGKYIAPQMLEMRLEGDPYIEMSAVIADLRKYVTALIVPNYVKLEAYAKEQGIEFANRKDLIANEQIQKFYTDRIAQTMVGTAAFEQVKYFTLIEHPFTSDNGELTLTLKLKRKVINEHYAAEIEKMYEH